MWWCSSLSSGPRGPDSDWEVRLWDREREVRWVAESPSLLSLSDLSRRVWRDLDLESDLEDDEEGLESCLRFLGAVEWPELDFLLDLLDSWRVRRLMPYARAARPRCWRISGGSPDDFPCLEGILGVAVASQGLVCMSVPVTKSREAVV